MASTQRRHARRGFSLVELMTVVIIVIVLATLAVYAVRKYVWSAKTTEAYDMINSIKSAQEAYRAETFAYCNVSTGCGASGGSLQDYWPNFDPGQGKASWGDGTCTTPSQCVGFRTLGVTVSSAMQFRYGCMAGAAGAVAVDWKKADGYQLPANATGPWFVVQAVGDQDADGLPSAFISSSFSSDVYTEHETE